ncbi:MAG TPA: alpha-ribazole phosphatase [Burkholderiaceae bacterium]|nr:alpha-ribazole phosphatase [Burkholderiaceae bacterium]
MQAFLIRHPRPDVAPGVCYGATDLELAQDALDCVAHVRTRLPAQIRLFSSPMRRCRRLAEMLDPAVCYDSRLSEMDFGAWEMHAWSRIPRAELDAWAAAPMTFVPPGGESVATVRARVIAFLDERCRPGGEDIAVVTHAGVLRIIAGHLQELDQATWFNLQFGHGQLTVLQVPAPPGG